MNTNTTMTEVNANAAAPDAPAPKAPKANKGKGKGEQAPAKVEVVAGFDTPAALDLHLASLDTLKGRELQDALALTIDEIAKRNFIKKGGKWFGPCDAKGERREHTLSSDRDTRKAQMDNFAHKVKAQKVLTQRVHLYLDKRGVGELTTSYRANVSTSGMVRTEEKQVLKLGAKRASVNI